MIVFKHLKEGTSLIEVMAAIAILAIFGSSIFLMQQYLFERIMVTQMKLTAHLRMQEELVEYQKNIIQEQLEQDGVVEKSLQPHTKKFSLPDMTIQISTKSNIASKPEGSSDDQESAFKIFKDVHVITATADQDTQNLGQMYQFVYVPKVEKA